MDNISYFANIGNYVKKQNDNFKSSENKSISDVIKNFQIIQNDFNSILDQNDEDDIHYSSVRLDECSQDEMIDFHNRQLQFIETLVINSIYERTGMSWNWGNIYMLTRDPEYAKVEKINRKVVYPSYGTQRPVGDNAYMIWNGLQIIDLDIKDERIANELKLLLFNELSKYNWFLGLSKSASKKSLHIWTKIHPISIEFKSRKIEYLCNFRHKYSYVYIALLKYKDKVGYTKDNIIEYIDMAMCKPQQGIFIPSDESYISTNFKDLRIDFNFEETINDGIENINWMFHKDLNEIFQKLDWFNTTDTLEAPPEISNYSEITESEYSGTKNPKHYKHNQRWQIANTLTKIYGAEKAFDIICQVCKDTPKRELKGDIRTASIHDKPISKWAVEELNKFHGFNIKVKEDETAVTEKIKEIDEEINKSEVEVDPLKIINEKIKKVRLYITKDQYLSDIKDEIIANLGKITLLESGAGTGKTEMIKAMDKKTLLILPFTSTIKAKVEYSETTKDWLYYYGNKRPTLEELVGEQSMAMTIDKFSRLNLVELDAANFEYIIIDESHLIFTSSYRDVMGPTIQRLANSKSKIIMMSGTPTGEIIFFPNITHIKVDKEETREKTFTLFLCKTQDDLLLDMSDEMAKAILTGRKILYPTNKGNLYFEQVTGLIQKRMNRYPNARQLKKFYYKKSNYGEESMNNINMNKTVGENDIIFCSTYLSVGVDICDADDFEVYFSELFISQDIEQFANRLRNKNLHIKMFLPKFNNDGFLNDFISMYVKPLDLSINKKEIIFAHDLVKTCNDMIERNKDEAKYNPIIQSLIASNKYIKYDDTDAKYYIDETTYKLNVFEDKYSEYAKQLKVLMEAMKEFNYVINPIVERDELLKNQSEKDAFEQELQSVKNAHYNKETDDIFKFLDHISDENIDIYKELLKGNYEIFKSDKYKEYRGDNDLYVENIEVLEKNTPIVIQLYRFYDCKTIKQIYEFCLDSKKNKINFSKLNRIRKLVLIEFNKKKRRLDFPIMKFVKDAYDYAILNPVLDKYNKDHYTQICINGKDAKVPKFIVDYSTKYVNSVEGLVVNDNEYYMEIINIVRNLWDVVIVQSRPHNNKIKIEPFDLIWERKDIIDNIWGDTKTKEFLLQEFIENIKEDAEEEIGEFEVKNKITEEDIEDKIPSIIHSDYEYDNYSELDGSNDRFIRKQENTQRLDTLKKRNEEPEPDKILNKDLILFNF